MLNNRFKQNILFKLLAVFILLIFLHYFKITQPIENFISYFFLPIQADLYQQGVELNNDWDMSVLNQKELAYQNQLLKEKNQELVIEQSRLLEIGAENKLLREQLNFFENKEYTYLVARVVGSNLNNNIYSYILDKGADDGIKKGQAVIFNQGIIVGKIYQVFPKQSELLLLSDNKNALAAVVQNKDISQGIIGGQYGLSMKMDFIPQNEQINPGEIVITSGLEDFIPRGLIVGKIDKVESKVNDLFQTAIISPAVDYDKINLVSIITGWKDKIQDNK